MEKRNFLFKVKGVQGKETFQKFYNQSDTDIDKIKERFKKDLPNAVCLHISEEKPMGIIEQKGITKDGMFIHIEDWKKIHFPRKNPYVLVAYPKVMANLNKRMKFGCFVNLIRKGHNIRVSFSFESKEQGEQMFSQLLHGEKNLFDLESFFDSSNPFEKKEFFECLEDPYCPGVAYRFHNKNMKKKEK